MLPKIHSFRHHVASLCLGYCLLTTYHSQAIIHTSAPISSDSCLTIILQNGNSIQAKKIKVFEEKIRYSRCDDESGQDFIYQKRADVASISGQKVDDLVFNKTRREQKKEALLKTKELRKEQIKKQNKGWSFVWAVLAICLITLSVIIIQALKSFEEGLRNITFEWR